MTVAMGALVLRGPGRALLGCEPIESGPDRHEILQKTVSIVFLPTFAELATSTETLASDAAALRDAPSTEALERVRTSWKNARRVWKVSEVFLLGPSDDLAVTGGAIDAWPAAPAKIDAIVTGTDTIDETTVSTLSANMRGFPGAEYLLFDSTAAPSDVDRRLLEDEGSPRRRQFLAAQCADLAKKCRAVQAGWDGAGGFGHELAEAGYGSKLFLLQRDAMDKVVTAMVALAELAVVAKLAKPLGLDTGGPPSPAFEEAPESDTSLEWIGANLAGLQAVYECRAGDNRGLSIGDAVAFVSPAADKSFRTAIEDAKKALAAIDAPMRTLLAGDTTSLVALHGAVQKVKRSLVTDVASALGASIGFGYSDTD
ncbi:MAG: imelysin family protein [Polyangiaceae bacterium]